MNRGFISVAMPTVCSACSSGSKKSPYVGSWHSLPSSDKRAALREKWIRAAPFDWKPCKTARICGLHFSPSDYIVDRVDSNISRNNSNGELILKRLKDDAIPHIWVSRTPDVFLSKRSARKFRHLKIHCPSQNWSVTKGILSPNLWK